MFDRLDHSKTSHDQEHTMFTALSLPVSLSLSLSLSRASSFHVK